MSVVVAMLFIVLVAVANLGLGFAAAVMLGHRARTVRAPATTGPVPTVAAAPPRPATPSPTAPAEKPPQESAPQRAALDSALEQFKQAMQRDQTELVAVDERLRDEQPTVEKMQQCVDELKDVGQRYLQQREQITEQLDVSADAPAAARDAGQQVIAAADAGATQVRETLSRVDDLELEEATLEQDRTQLLSETGALSQACRELGETVDEALTPPSPEAAEEPSAPTGLADQEHVESAVARWCAEHDGSARLCLGLVDVDQFDQLTDQFGAELAQRAVSAVGQAAVRSLDGNVLIAPSNERQFLLMLPGLEPQEATVGMERLRQLTDNTTFASGQEQLRITVSCAVVRFKEGDDLNLMQEKATAALNEAKRYGRNRTFVHEGEFPTPVVPLDLEIPEDSVSI